MKIFTTKISAILSGLLALVLWQLLSVKIDNKILLVSPVTVLVRLGELIVTLDFWQAIAFTIGHILLGFVLAILFGIVLGILAGRYKILEVLLWPYVAALKAIPVASVVVLCLIWLTSRNLSVFISFMIGFPVMYFNVLEGYKNQDKKYMELAQVYEIRGLKKLKNITLPQLMPYILSAIKTISGLCFKAGVAAEIIAIPPASIGKEIYLARIGLDVASLMAYTLVIVLISLIIEKILAKK